MTSKLPLDCMEFTRIAKNAENISDQLYKKSMYTAIKEHKYWQTMDYLTHPLVERAHEAQLRNSDTMYKEDALAQLGEAIFCADMTEQYETAKKLKLITSNAAYTKEAKYLKSNTKYNYMLSDEYKLVKSLNDVKGDRYTSKAKELAEKPIPTTTFPEMETAKILKPFSKAHYTKEAAELARKYNLTMDDQQIAHSLRVSDITSEKLYHANHKKNIIGTTTKDLALHSYPAEENANKVSKLLSENLYRKEGKEQAMTGKLPLDCMQFELVKTNALNASDALYRKSRIAAIKEHKYWQTMDPLTHPVTVARQEAILRNSDALYKEDAKASLDEVYYPVYITEGYELAKKVSEATSDAIYKKHARSIEAKHKFNYGDSEMYKQNKDLSQVLVPREYSTKAKELMAKGPREVMHEEMATAKRLGNYWSQTRYQASAKKLAEKYNLTMDTQSVAESLRVSDIVSERKYRAGFKKDILGKTTKDLALHSYPVEANNVKVSKDCSEALYRKDGKALAMTGKLPLDCMEFERVKKNAMNMSDANYRSTRIDAIKTHKAWQTMDYFTHPVVEKAHQSYLLNSDAYYKEDAKAELDTVYYPVQITEGYE
jgi:hypothetical protein